jgi:hypothetical protein
VALRQCREKRGNRGVITKGLAEMGKAIDIAWTENKTATELKWILADPSLCEARNLCFLAATHVVRTQHMKDVGLLELERGVRFPVFVNEQRETDAGVFNERSSEVDIAESNRREFGAAFLELRLMLAQLRDVLTAEDSTVMAKEYDYRWIARPERTESNGVAVRIRQRDVGEGLRI